jgi:Cd2+/Zn2+-exporting ATPase
LVISVPLSFFGGIGGASRKGILIKGANYLEALAKVKTVAFDKTGTLTCGTFEVTALHPHNCSEQELLELAALAESYSNHPIAQSIVRAFDGDLERSCVTDTEELSGRGIRSVIDGREVLVGNEKLVKNVEIPREIGTVVYLSVDGEYRGCVVISDALKADAAQAIAELKSLGVSETVMLTGDRESVGRAVAAKLGLDRAEAELMPHQKVERLEKLLSEKPSGSTLAYVGDGINDAPVLTRADVGLAMGALGGDAAIEAADVVLMDDQPTKISVAIRLARKTMRIVYQNIIFAIGIKVLALVLVALGAANMWIAIFADVGVMILAVLNAIRALFVKKI